MLPAKMHLDGKQGWFGRTTGSAGPTSPPLATILLWYTAWWVLMSDGQCRGLVGRFGLSGGPLLLLLRRTRYSVIRLRILHVFFLFRTYAPKNINSPKQLWC